MILAENPLLRTDVYKMGHMVQYAPGTEYVYSHLVARSGKKFPVTVFYGLQYYLQRYLTQPLEPWMAEEFLQAHHAIIGPPSEEVADKIRDLCRLGYWPIKIKAVPEGTVMPVRNVLMTIANTHPSFSWCVGFVESLLLKVWYPITVATQCYMYRQKVEQYWRRTVGSFDGIGFAVHDFGYRGDTTEEGAPLAGVGHLLSFTGSDTILSWKFAQEYYDAPPFGIMHSVPASEHSVMCSFGREDELAAFRHMLELYPKGIVSIVSDTFNVYDVLTKFVDELYPLITVREGKVVFRPDSGDPETVICGDDAARPGTPEAMGALRLLEYKFGSTVNESGYRVLNAKVGLIYGDGMYMERFDRILARMQQMGFAASNLVIGVGGILRNHSRDTLGFAIKATCVHVDGVRRDIEKDPITDPGKKSLKGLLRLDHITGDEWVTRDQVSEGEEEGGELRTVFLNGKITQRYTLAQIRARVAKSPVIPVPKAA